MIGVGTGKRVPLPKEWSVVRDRTGHHRAVYMSSRMNDGDVLADESWRHYPGACQEADRLNLLAEVLSS